MKCESKAAYEFYTVFTRGFVLTFLQTFETSRDFT